MAELRRIIEKNYWEEFSRKLSKKFQKLAEKWPKVLCYRLPNLNLFVSRVLNKSCKLLARNGKAGVFFFGESMLFFIQIKYVRIRIFLRLTGWNKSNKVLVTNPLKSDDHKNEDIHHLIQFEIVFVFSRVDYFLNDCYNILYIWVWIQNHFRRK